MIAGFERLSLGWGALLVIGGFVAGSLLLARVVARFVGAETLREHNELTGFIFAVVGVIYAVVLGFVAIGVWDRFVSAEDRTFNEASNLTVVYRDAWVFENEREIRTQMREYVDAVVSTGYPALQAGRHSRPTALRAERLFRTVQGTVPRGARESALYADMLAALRSSILDRDARLTEDSGGLIGIMWVVVYLGGFITIAFSYMFGFKQTAMQTAMIGTLALLIGLVIFLTMSLDYPFRGAIHVGPDAFERAQYVFGQIDAADRSQTP